MRPAKFNRSQWYSLALMAVLLFVCSFLVVGATWARYADSMDAPAKIDYTVREFSSVHLMTNVNYMLEGPGTWKADGDQRILDFYVTNGTDLTEYSPDDQKFSVRLVGSAGFMTAEDEVSVTLTLDGEDHEGTVESILNNTSLKQEFGSGWLFTFLDEDGEELTWDLEGGALSVRTGQITVSGGHLTDSAMLQLQVIGEPA